VLINILLTYVDRSTDVCILFICINYCYNLIQVTELSMGELLMHSTVSWLNPFPSLGKARKDLELTVFGKFLNDALLFQI